MHVAYLVNQYPKVSHTVIKREILALESLGLRVTRFALRANGTKQLNPRDAEEFRKTRYLTRTNLLSVAVALLHAVVTNPVALPLLCGLPCGSGAHRIEESRST